MILTADYHTHTPFSHGKNTVAENAFAAKEKGLKELGIADHGFAHMAFGIRRKDLAKLKEEAAVAEKEYGVRVLVGVEANLLGLNGKTDLKESDYPNFDFFLCGYHLLVKTATASDFFSMLVRNSLKMKPNDSVVKRNTKTYINAIKNNPIDAITHLSYRFPCDAIEVAKCAADYGTYIELNSKKTHLTDEELMEMTAKTSVRFLINSDAHAASRVGDKRIVEEQLARLSFPTERIDNVEGRLPAFRFQAYKLRQGL
ncbi:MAG: PHP domain-containing protein [Clostridia bacterium]|nr:PHP domain-containing protein [Clostridia bacterium]